MQSLLRVFLLSLFLPCAAVLLFSRPAHAQGFEDCVQNINNATIVVPHSVQATVAGDSLSTGDEIAVFTDDGTCAGRGVWNDESLSIAAAGADSQHPVGFEPDEPITFRVWEASSSTVYEADVRYETCDGGNPLCEDDGLYQNNVLFSVVEMETVVTLPVELTAFDATVDGQATVLQWATASETNNAGFEVQHRTPDAAPDAWTTAGFVEGNGSTTEATEYTHRLDELTPGTHTFRLKQVDLDGSFEYSESVEVDVHMSAPFELAAPYPNPFRQQATFSLRVAESQRVGIVAYNQLGQHVATLHDGELTPNTKHTFALAGQRLASGMYFIQVQGETFRATERAILVR